MILKSVISGLIVAYFIISGVQTCFTNPNVNQRGEVSVSSGRQVIVSSARFTCNGRITNVAVSMSTWRGDGYPHFQVWHPTLLNSSTYSKIGEVQLPGGDFVAVGQGRNYYYATLLLKKSSQIEFQSGDVIGYYQPPNPRKLIWSIQTSGYTSYSSNVITPLTVIDTNNVDNIEANHQPLIEVKFDIRCDNLSTPANGSASCSSGRTGVGYKGDTCSFTCDTGFELTGSNSRTCQSDGSWSGVDNACRRIHCHKLVNGILQCPNGAVAGVFGDSCMFSCNAGYKLQGHSSGLCLANRSWSGGDPICVALNCSTSPPLNNSRLQSSCDTQYQSTCTTVCVDGYTGVGGSHTCVVTDEDTNSVGWSGSTSCQRVRCPELKHPINGTTSCLLINRPSFSYEDTCSFRCNIGHELFGSSNRTCQSSGNWSGTDAICRRVSCSSLTNPNNGMINCSLGDDGVPSYEDTCSFTCDTGYELISSDKRTCQSDGSWSSTVAMCRRVSCSSLTNLNNGLINCSLGDDGVHSYEDTCTFTCNTGYELISNDNTICQSDGTWSGTVVMCRRVSCSSLTDPNNGMINCSVGDDGVPSYEDICTFTCNTGYELIGNDNYRTCQSDGSWSGSVAMCRRVSCSLLTNPNNGLINCSLGGDGVHSYEDTCSFTCNTGYQLVGTQRICQSNGRWSGSPVSCIIMECPSSSLPMNSMLSESCSSTYQSQCGLQCQEGFNGTGNPSYVCDVLNNRSSVTWIAKGDVWRCERVHCTSLSSLTNGVFSCNSTDVSRYEDQCSFSCDPGYELIGSSSRQCLSNASWSGSDVTCDILHCDNLTDTIENSVLANDCGSEFGSVCRTKCNTGYRAVGNDTFTCVNVNDTVEWINNINGATFQCNIVTCEDLETPYNGSIDCSSNNQPLQYKDSCTFQCDDGYELQGSVIRQCEASGEWSGSSTQCNIRHCPNITTLIPNSRSCDTFYTSTCVVECEEGYRKSGDSSQYDCDLNGTEIVWTFTGSGATCSPVSCVTLGHPENGNVTCISNTSVFQDTCKYYCNRGYQLVGDRQTRCTADETWSNEPVTCTALKCNDPEVEITSSQLVGICNVTYGSSCLLHCSSGFSASGNGEHVCDDVNDDGTSVKWRNVGSKFTCIDTASDNKKPTFSTTAISGAIGGLLLLIIIIVFVLVTLLCNRKSQKKQKCLFSAKFYNNICNGNIMCEAPISTPQSGYKEPHILSSHKEKLSIVEKALSSMNRTVSAAPNNASLSTQPCLANHLCAVTSVSISPCEMAESIAAEESFYHTLCEGEGSIGKTYNAPLSDEQRIYKEFEGKRFQKLYHEELVICGELGSGEFGNVTFGKWTSFPYNKEVQVAIKTLNSGASDKDRLRFIQEAAIMCQFDHENVVKLYGVVTEAPIMIVLEYMPHGDLKNLLLKLQPPDLHPKLPIVLLKFCQEIAAGMAYLSGKHFIHRDLAARNILVSETITCKIADFGMSRDLIDENYYITSGGKVPFKWTAPEALHYRKYSVYSDVWSYGCVLYEIWSLGHSPFETMDTDETIRKIESGYRLPPPPGCPRAIYRTMIKCWNPDPRSRPPFEQQLVNMLAGNDIHLLGWSDEDIQVCNKETMTLGAPLESANHLYHDLQITYVHTG